MTFTFESPELEGRPDPFGLRSPTGQAFMLYTNMLPVDDDGLPAPNFTTAEVAKVFFGRKASWLRWAEGRTGQYHGVYRYNQMTLDGRAIEPRLFRNRRRYNLVDIERMAHGLAQGGSIGGERLISILTVVRNVALLNGVQL